MPGETMKPQTLAEETHGLLASVVELSDDAIFLSNLEGLVVSWNAGAEAILGYGAAEIVGKPASLLIPREWFKTFQQFRRKLQSGERISNYETTYVQKNGQRIQVVLNLFPLKNAAGEIVGIASILRDITARKSAEDALRENEARIRGILESTVDGIITIHENGRIESFNAAAARIFGYAPEEVIGKSINILMPTPFREQHDDYLHNYLTTGIKKIIGIGREVQGLRKDGSVFPIHLSVSEARISSRRLFTGIVRDLTEQKRLERQVLHGERLATIGKMAAKVAHEIRSPLSSISLNAELLEDELSGYEGVNTVEAQSLLRSIIAEIERVTSLTEEYLQFSRLPESQVLNGDLNHLVDGLVEFLRHEVRQKRIELNYAVNGAALQVRFDPVQLRRALLNIVRNAIEAMPKGGQLSITTARVEGKAVIRIRDNGVGISEEELERIFDPFFTTKDFGTGLGLAVVQQIIDEHCGQILCESKRGQGSTFSIFLPLT